ncbi:MAG: hypothetical protein QM680_13970 [Luteolibacter sp.]
MKTKSENTPEQAAKPGCVKRLVRDLTGISDRKRSKIIRMIERLEEELDDNDLVVFCGNCNDEAYLMHRETGIWLGTVGNCSVFMGGDLPINRLPNGIEYSRDLSPTSGDFANAKSQP